MDFDMEGFKKDLERRKLRLYIHLRYIFDTTPEPKPSDAELRRVEALINNPTPTPKGAPSSTGATRASSINGDFESSDNGDAIVLESDSDGLQNELGKLSITAASKNDGPSDNEESSNIVALSSIQGYRQSHEYGALSKGLRPDKMAGKKSVKVLAAEGLERTDNGMAQTSWTEVPMINQKNYYTDYMKKDKQVLALRQQHEQNFARDVQNRKDKDRALALNPDAEVEESNGNVPELSKILVIHPGSQNLRIGLASDALPKTVPMTVAYRYACNESQNCEPRPKRQKVDTTADAQFDAEFSRQYAAMSAALKTDMRANKRKVLPNSKELVINYNRRIEPEKIPEHNDPMRIDWTDISKAERLGSFGGTEALRIPDFSEPRYMMFRPIQHGCYNENDYTNRTSVLSDFEWIIEHAMRKELGLNSSTEWKELSCVFVIPDLYDKIYVEEVAKACLEGFEFKQVTFIQETLAASYGAGYSNACIVDIGAQKTSISCVEDGMIIEDSRINLKYGGYDITETFIKMLLFDHFPYADINLKRRYDFLLAEELKQNFCTMNQAEISVQLYNFHLRAPNQPTRKYQFKTYDEVILAPMSLFEPSIFDNSDKLAGRHTLIDRSYNTYDTDLPDDPMSSAQLAILTAIKPSIGTTANGFKSAENGLSGVDLFTPVKEKSNPFLSRLDETNSNSRVTSAAGSPAPEGTSTPQPFAFGANGTNGGSPGPGANNGVNHGTPIPPAGMFVDQNARTAKDLAIERDSVLPIAPLDTAILTSIMHAAKNDEKKFRDFVGGIMVIGGGAKTPGLTAFLEERLKQKRPDLAEKILVGANPKEMDGQVVAWKGASVFGRMGTHESWIDRVLWERQNARAFHFKVIWQY